MTITICGLLLLQSVREAWQVLPLPPRFAETLISQLIENHAKNSGMNHSEWLMKKTHAHASTPVLTTFLAWLHVASSPRLYSFHEAGLSAGNYCRILDSALGSGEI